MKNSASVAYFAYGSNMLRERMAKHLKSTTDDFDYGCRAFAAGSELAFNKLKRDGSAAASIVPNPLQVVQGVLYFLSTTQWEALKGSEGSGYREQPLDIVVEDSQVKAISLVASKPQERIKPTREYVDTILGGAREHGLSENYIAAVAAKAGI